VTAALDSLPDDINALRTALAAEQLARREAEARASGAEAMIAHLKLMIAKLRHDRFGASSERGRKLLDQLELELEEAETAASEAETGKAGPNTPVRPFTRRKPVGGRCRTTCRANAWCCQIPAPARAAVAGWPSWVRRSRKPWR